MSLTHSIPTNGHLTQVITGVLALEQPVTNSKWNVGAMLLHTVGILLRLQDQFQFTDIPCQDTQGLLLAYMRRVLLQVCVREALRLVCMMRVPVRSVLRMMEPRRTAEENWKPRVRPKYSQMQRSLMNTKSLQLLSKATG